MTLKFAQSCPAGPTADAAIADRNGCWQAWFDGSAHPNPGNIGIGVLLLAPDGTRHERSVRAGAGCNNEAELSALCAVLELADSLGARRLLVRGDSDVAVRYVRGQESTAIAPLCALIARAQAGLARFAEVQLLWIPRHRNGEADRLSRAALGLPDKPAVTGKAKRRRR